MLNISTKKSINKYLFLILGLVLGAVSVIIGQIPSAVAAWSGLRIIGNNVGYLLAILIVAYCNCEKWTKAFLHGTLTNVVATLIYYGLIFIIQSPIADLKEALKSVLIDTLFWSATGALCASIAACAMWLLRHAKKIWVRYASVITTYIAMIGITYWIEVIPVANMYAHELAENNGYLTGYYAGHNYTSDRFGIVFAVVLVTLFFVIALTRLKEEKAAE